MLKFSTFNLAGLATAALLALPLSVQGQTLLEENFEGVQKDGENSYSALGSLAGWETVEPNSDAAFPKRWCVYHAGSENNRNNVAYVDISDYSGQTYKGSNYLLTPWVTLDGAASVQFTWASSAMARENKEYDLRVRVVEEGKEITSNPFIFSINDPDMVRESGVPEVNYGWYTVPWEGWAKNVSTLDLSQYAGKKIRIAFEYWYNGCNKLNSIELDNVKIFRSQAVDGPKPATSISEWDFGKVYVGSKMLSEVFTLRNSGKDLLTVSGYDASNGFSLICEKPASEISLRKNEEVRMQIVYDASMTSAATGNVTIHTNGGDAEVAVRASKQMLPEGYSFEGFEGCEKVFPPAGWTVNGSWRVSESPIEGYLAAYSMADLEPAAHDLITPRLDGSAGSLTFEFDYYDLSNDEDGLGCDNTVDVFFSKDGGLTWKLLKTYDYNGPYNERIHQKFTEQTDGSDNCFFKISYEPLEEYDTEYGPEISIFYVDAVILPTLYGADAAPSKPELTAPAADARDIYPKGIALSWKPAQFADGYKLYVGSDGAATNLVNGLDLGNALEYTIAEAAYATTYNWYVEAYNGKGSSKSGTRAFTTQADVTVRSLPWKEGFESGLFPPVGWVADNCQYTKWSTSDFGPMEGKYAACVQAGLVGDVATLTTPDIVLPAEPAYLSYFWGDGSGAYLKIDESGTMKNPTQGSNGIADLDLEIYADGQWHHLAKLSDPNADDNLYWYRERIDLTPYAGKTVALRWKRSIFNYSKGRTAVIDNIAIENIVGEKLSLNFDSWDAMKVNYNASVSSGNIFTLLNDGSNEAEVASVTFNGTCFETSLKAGDKIASASGIPFYVKFNAGQTADEVSDVMTVTTRGGATVSMNLHGIAMPQDTRFYGFETDEVGSLQPKEFITVDEDRASCVPLGYVTYPNRGLPQAFMVINYKKVDWPNPYPNTGDQNLVSFATMTYTTADWIIKRDLTATADSKFEFWGRNYEHFDPYGPAVFSSAKCDVMVSQAEDPTDLTQYERVATYTLECPVKEEYKQFVTDLGEYAGKKIHVAMVSRVDTNGLAYLYDDFTYHHFTFDLSGISSVVSNDVKVRVEGDMVLVEGAEASLSIYNMAGMEMMNARGNSLNIGGLQAGVYLLRVNAGGAVSTLRFVKR